MNRLFGLALASGLALAASAGPSRADTRDFTFVNATGARVTAMWVSTYGDRYWRAVRPFYAVSAGASEDIDFENSGPCQVQLKIALSNGAEPEWTRAFNLCSVSRITVWYDPSEGRYHANYG